MLRIRRDTQVNTSLSQEKYVPLKRVNINATIRSFAADVVITQVFRNDEATSVEAVYCFPIEEQAAVYRVLDCFCEWGGLKFCQKVYNFFSQKVIFFAKYFLQEIRQK
jgi:hypothetical protein